MKYIKAYESDDIAYSLNDIVICTMKKNKYRDYLPYVDQDGKLIEDKKHVRYGKKYKIIQIYYSKQAYNKVRTNFELYNFLVDVEDIETGKKITYVYADHFRLPSKFQFPDEPMVGDYVICDVNFLSWGEPAEELNNFINTHVGRYVQPSIIETESNYVIEWSNIPISLMENFYNTTNPYIKNQGRKHIKREQIKEYSPNKNKLEYIENIDKYNL